MEKRIFPLSVVTKRINDLLEPAINKQFWVKAEIASGRERGGAFYCDLVETDTNGKIVAKMACTIWQRDLSVIKELFKSRQMDFVLDNGTVVGFLCSLQFSPQYGISLKVIDADPAFALGEMELKKQEIIKRLQAEELFDPNKRCFLPMLPMNIGFVTSDGSAAYNDFIQTLTASGYGFKVHFADAMMQGDQTEKSVLKAITALQRLGVELIVIARGGGSKTDLYHLDNEAIARAIAASPIPVWTGIGHEIDTSVLDYVANRNFKTPTAAAEELVACFDQMQRQLEEATSTLKTVWTYRLKMDAEYLVRATTGLRQGARKLLDVTASDLRVQAQELRHHVSGRLANEQMKLEGKRGQLKVLPINFMHRQIERIAAKGQNLGTQVKFALSGSRSTLALLKGRFEVSRFLKRIRTEQDLLDKTRQQITGQFKSSLAMRVMQQNSRKDRFKIERILKHLRVEQKSLADKMATLRAIDPQNALNRGFALVYRPDGSLVKSIHDIALSDRISTQVSDGTLTSEVTAKESRNG